MTFFFVVWCKWDELLWLQVQIMCATPQFLKWLFFSFYFFCLILFLVKTAWQRVWFIMEVRPLFQFCEGFLKQSARRCDVVSCFFTLSPHFLHSGLQAAPRLEEQSPWPVWPDWARVWKSLHWKPRTWVPPSWIRIAKPSKSWDSAACFCSAAGNRLAERATDWRWTDDRGRRPHQRSSES